MVIVSGGTVEARDAAIRFGDLLRGFLKRVSQTDAESSLRGWQLPTESWMLYEL